MNEQSLCYRRVKIIGILVFVLLAFIQNNQIVIGNSPPLYMQGGTTFPINNDAIVLEKETIHLYFGGEEHRIEVIFHFHNTGNETDLQIGFPNLANYGESINNFKAFQYPEMQEYSVEKKPGGIMPGLDQYMYNSMYAWTMHFKADERKSLFVSYSFYNTQIGESDGGYADYILETGALWKDGIQSIDVIVEFPEKAALCEIFASPENYFYNGEGIEWHFENIEPDFNLSVSYQKLPDILKHDWMYKTVQKESNSSEYQWNNRLFVVDLFERWNLDEMLLTEETTIGLSSEAKKMVENCNLAKNEIYARHGVKLQNEWDAFFRQFPWYTLKKDFTQEEFNDVEKLNLVLIEDYLNHIQPGTEEKKLAEGLDTLYQKYGDAFFRHYPVSNREENLENIQSTIDQRLDWWNRNKPVNLGACLSGEIRPPEIELKEIDIPIENVHHVGVTENGYPILALGAEKILFEKEGKLYEVYQKTIHTQKMYEGNMFIPENNSMFISVDFYDYNILSKWCKQVKHPDTGESIYPMDYLLLLPETGEIYSLAGLGPYYSDFVWSENSSVLAYTWKDNGHPVLHTFDINNRVFNKYDLPHVSLPDKILVSDIGEGFLEYDETIWYASPTGNMVSSLELSGQMLCYDNSNRVLTYVAHNEIHRYSIEQKSDQCLEILETDIWKVEKQDPSNYLLYCHPEYYYIYNRNSQETYRYGQDMNDSYILWKVSPSGNYAMKVGNQNQPFTFLKGNTNDKWELNLPATTDVNWYSDDEVSYFELREGYYTGEDLIVDHIYNIHSGEKTKVRFRNKTYVSPVMRHFRDGCYHLNNSAVLANAIIHNPETYGLLKNKFGGITENRVPVGILSIDGDFCNCVYYNSEDDNIYEFRMNIGDLELYDGSTLPTVGYIMDAAVHYDYQNQEIMFKKCSAFVEVLEEKEDRLRVSVVNILDGWIDRNDFTPGFISSDKAENTVIPTNSTAQKDRSAIAEDTNHPVENTENAIEAVNLSQEGKNKKAYLVPCLLFAASILILLAVGFFIINNRIKKSR